MMKIKRRPVFLSAVIAGIVAASFICGKYLYAKEMPNVLFIVVDTLRSDHLGCYGYRNISTPNIDSLARCGTLFKEVISQIPLTTPSHASLFTSTYPQFNKVRDNAGYKLDSSCVTLAQVLRDNGYSTAAFVSSIVLDSKYGLNKGFQVYDDNIEKPAVKKVIRFMDEERKADQVTGAAIGWLKGNKDKKFFLWVHYYDPHALYNPPLPYKQIYAGNPYDAEIAFVDEYIGVLLRVLRELSLDKKTLIVFTSDHGEGLGEHKETGHGIFLYDSTLKVPLIFCYPGIIPQGRVVENQVRLIDIMPTLLDLLGIKKSKEIQGTSLTSMIKGSPKRNHLDAYSESFYANFHFNWEPLVSLRTEEWKYIKSNSPELYNIKEDGRELVNLAGQRPDIVRDLNQKIEVLLKKSGASGLKEEKLEIDEETKEKLLSLGYIQGGVGQKEKKPVPREMLQVIEKINLADRMANSGMTKEAVEEYKELIKIDKNNMELYLHLAQCYKNLGDYDEAIRYFQKAASFKPDEPEVHDDLGNIYKNMGRVEEAHKEFELALRLDPDNPAIINNIGWYYQQKLEIDKAMEQYQKVIQLEPDIATAHANLAICLRIKGQLDKAMQELKKALEIDPELSLAHSELCALVATQGDIDAAIPHCQRAIELQPNSADGYINLGVCYERRREYEKALANYSKAQEITPWDSLIYFNMGNVYADIKQPEEAIKNYKKALELNPGFKKAAHMLGVLTQNKKNNKKLDK